MPLYVQYPSSGALIKRCMDLQAAARADSPLMRAAREDFRLIVAEDHTHMLFRGVDRYGQPRAPLAPSTLANKHRGPGPSLIPRWSASRFATNAEVIWQSASDGAAILVKRFRDMAFAQFHFTGTRNMPRRDVGGVSRAGFAQLTARFRKLAADLAAVGRPAGTATTYTSEGARILDIEREPERISAYSGRPLPRNYTATIEHRGRVLAQRTANSPGALVRSVRGEFGRAIVSGRVLKKIRKG